jgi:exodeoxyribonuclease VII small subunit
MAKKRLSFEKSLETLEKIVEELESGDLTLDEALARYERGMAAHKECAGILAAAEKRIEVLLEQDDGFETEPLEGQNDDGENDEDES